MKVPADILIPADTNLGKVVVSGVYPDRLSRYEGRVVVVVMCLDEHTRYLPT
jgi:hypothetical protein